MTKLTLDLGQAVAEAALAKAREIGSPSSIAVLDAGRELVAFARMDGAPLASVPIAQAKAYTARSLDTATRDLDDLAQPGAALFVLQVSHLAVGRALITFGGGLPITVDGEVIGAVGVAGGTPDQDHAVAEAGAAAAKNAS